MKKLFVVVALLALTGCVTGPSLQSRMAAFEGASSQTLVQQLGVPDKQITVDGVLYLAYVRHRTDITPGIETFGGGGPFYGGAPFYGPCGGAGFYGAEIPPEINTYTCDTTFMLKDDKVVNFTLRGNDCQ